MDQRERINDQQESLRAAIEGMLAELWTAMPGIVQSFDPATVTCVVQPAIKLRRRHSDGTFTFETPTVLFKVPVHYPGGGIFLVTFPLAAGDEVLLVFASRCIDSWWQNSGVQIPAEIRLHDLSDGFAIPKVWSQPNVPTAVSTTTAQLRTSDGTAYIELAPGGVVNIKAPGGINVTGTLGATGEITAKVGAGNHTVSAHIHGGVTTGGGNTGTPTG